MKLFNLSAVLVILAMSLSASAAKNCPELSGKYTCVDQEDQDKREILIEQKLENREVVYSVPVVAENRWLIANGKKTGERDDYAVANCGDGDLTVKYYLKDKQHDITAILEIETLYKKDSNGQLTVYEKQRFRIDGQDIRAEKTEICTP